MSLQRKIVRNGIKAFNNRELPFADKNPAFCGRCGRPESTRTTEFRRLFNKFELVKIRNRLMSEGMSKSEAEDTAFYVCAANKAKASRKKRTWGPHVGAAVYNMRERRKAV